MAPVQLFVAFSTLRQNSLAANVAIDVSVATMSFRLSSRNNVISGTKETASFPEKELDHFQREYPSSQLQARNQPQ